MNNYSKLIVSHMISFKEVMVLHYKKIGLNEIEAMIIILLYENRKHSTSAITTKSLLPYVTLDEQTLSKVLVDLLERGFIELQLSDGKEDYSLLPTIEKLGLIIEKEDQVGSKQFTKDLKHLVAYVESLYNRTLSASEILIMQRWLSDDLKEEDILRALNEALRLNKTNLKYVDAILTTPKRVIDTTNVDEDFREVLRQIDERNRR